MCDSGCATKFDNEAFTRWMTQFESVLLDFEVSEASVKQFRDRGFLRAVEYFYYGVSAEDAALQELIRKDSVLPKKVRS